MDRLRVGVMIDPDNIPESGGGFSYHEALLKGINDYKFDDSIDIVNVAIYNKKKPTLNFKNECLYIKVSFLSKIRQKIAYKTTPFLRKIKKNIQSKSDSNESSQENKIFNFLKEKIFKKVETILAKNRIDILYYLTQNVFKYDYPFIITHWDVAHRSTYPFPETSMNGNYEIREGSYSTLLNKALCILCESEAGKKELLNYYSFYEPKIKVLPIFAGGIINYSVNEYEQSKILSNINVVKNQYFLYPAQFWALKNHYNLILAFKMFIEQEGRESIKLILTGSDKGNLSYILNLIQTLELGNSILILGFVSNDELYALYKNALALVMPTFLGPTNMPLIEAAYLNCPVICSDLEGHKEILGENAIYVNPSNKREIFDAMEQVCLIDRALFTQNAYERIVASKFNIENSLNVLNEILMELIPIRKTWGISNNL